jgi:hypothetical protein
MRVERLACRFERYGRPASLSFAVSGAVLYQVNTMAFYTDWFASSPQNAAETCKWLGTYMQLRHQKPGGAPPVSDWPIPAGEKEFFICWWMNQIIESDGFGSLEGQHPKDVEAFVEILDKVGAKQTSQLVREGLDHLKCGVLAENKCFPAYLDSVARDKVWLKTVKATGESFFARYSERAIELESKRKNLFNPKEWQKPWKD